MQSTHTLGPTEIEEAILAWLEHERGIEPTTQGTSILVRVREADHLVGLEELEEIEVSWGKPE